MLRALRSAFGWPAEDVVLAQMARQTETGFVGAPVGIMDPMAVSLASTDAALFLDTRSLAWKTVPIPPAVEIGVVDSGVTHRHSAGEYRTRREECDRAAKLAGVDELRDLFDAANWAAVAALPPPLDRRVLSESFRQARSVLAARRRATPLHSPQCTLHSLVCSDGEPRDCPAIRAASGRAEARGCPVKGAAPTSGCAGALAGHGASSVRRGGRNRRCRRQAKPWRGSRFGLAPG